MDDRTKRLAAEFSRVLRACLVLLFVLAVGGCATLPVPSHNAHGGYIPACGDKPPLVGDDC